ncbi:MAG: H/ACA ribonucleoprotein complex subunit GAR1 [Halobacteria archaeon]
MERLGKVNSETSAVAVVDSPEGTPTVVGRSVYDDGLNEVGRTIDVIGNVDSPYVVVEKKGDNKVGRGSKLYLR